MGVQLNKIVTSTDVQFSESFEIEGQEMFQRRQIGAGGRGLQDP